MSRAYPCLKIANAALIASALCLFAAPAQAETLITPRYECQAPGLPHSVFVVPLPVCSNLNNARDLATGDALYKIHGSSTREPEGVIRMYVFRKTGTCRGEDIGMLYIWSATLEYVQSGGLEHMEVSDVNFVFYCDLTQCEGSDGGGGNF